MNNFDTDMNLQKEHTNDSIDDPSITIITTKGNAVEIEELEAHIKQLESELHSEKSRNLNLSDLLDEEKR